MPRHRVNPLINDNPNPEVESPSANGSEPVPEPKPVIRIGDIVYFHEVRGNVPALVQRIYPHDNAYRLWVMGEQSVYPKDGVIEGTELGQLTRKD